jgi:hypothetical protein
MAQHLTTPPTAPDALTDRTRVLLSCGVVAGPLFLAVVFAQALTRDGFDLSRHPISLLSLGELGWIQIANFVVAGVLYVACAVGMRRVLHPGRGGTWGPVLVGGLGVGLILAGVFVADAGAGFPPGRAGRGPRAAQLARYRAHRRVRGRQPRDGRRLSGVRAPVRRPQPAGLGRSLRRDRGGGPGARPVA